MSDCATHWASGQRTGSVTLPDGRRLQLQAAGPTREASSKPAIVLVHGLGGTSSEWLGVQRCLARFARVYLYERAGYHGSDRLRSPPTPEQTAADLRTLLAAAYVPPPFLLVGHSYGGVLVRQFLADYTKDVFGMVIIDSPPVVNRFPAVWTSLLGGAEYEDVVDLRANTAIAGDEYRRIKLESNINEIGGGIADRELEQMVPCSQHLRARLHNRPLLGSRRLSVIFCDESNDFRKIYDHGVKHSFGTIEAREIVRRHLVDMSREEEKAQREHLTLSDNARFVKLHGKRATHNVHMVDPDWVARQVRWVLDGTEPEEA